MPCGRCPACLRNRQNEWVFRLNEEMRVSPFAYFFTLTYRDSDLPICICSVPLRCEIPTLSKRDIQLFLKRLRKNTGVKCKYHIVGEYGPSSLRPHYHGLIFSQFELNQDDIINAWQHQDLVFQIFEPCYGRDAVGYVTKYICAVPFLPEHLKELPRQMRPFTMCSKGLGLTFLECNSQIVEKKIGQMEDFVTLDGLKMAMPRYYRNKLFPITRDLLGKPIRDPSDIHNRMSLARQETILNLEDKRYKHFLDKHNLEDCDESRMKYNSYKKMIRRDLWRKAYKNSKYNLSKCKI